MKRLATRLSDVGLMRRLAALTGGLAAVLIVAHVLPIEFSAAHTGRLAKVGFAQAATDPPRPSGRQATLHRAFEPPDDGPPEAGLPEDGQSVDRPIPALFDSGPAEPLRIEPHREPLSVVTPARATPETPSGRPSPGFPVVSDLDGRFHRLGESSDCRAVVLVFLSPECPISNGAIPELNRLASEFVPRGVEWFGVVSDPAITRRRAEQHYRQFQTQFPVLFDASGELRAFLQPTHVPQCFALTAEGRVLYSGRLDDRYAALGRRRPQVTQSFLSDALDDILAGRPVAVPRTEPVGCLIEDRPAAVEGDVTWCRDIAPIVFGHCVSCHRPGEVGPFPFTNYEEVSRHARQIALVTSERIMPPWKPEPGFGHFRNERRLTARQIELLTRWAESGAPFGHPADLPPAPEFAAGWRLGPPDLVLELPEEFEVPAGGNDIYQYFVLPTGLMEDRAVTAIEFRPASPEVVHHASFCYDTEGEGRRLDAAEPGPGYRRFGGAGFTPDGSLGGWAPGVTPQHLPDGLGRPIAAGADLVVQVHYHPIGRPVRDRPRIGLYFADRPVRHRLAELIVADMNLRIPAGEPWFVHRASYELPVDATIHAAAPHMHLLGREMTVTAELPGGGIQPLIRIADWDFHWQDVYFYVRPLRLPAGTRIDVVCVYDNSAANPFNPASPPVGVRWGERSIDEMGICYFDVTTDRPEDLAPLIEHNQAEIARQVREHPWLLERPPEFRDGAE